MSEDIHKRFPLLGCFINNQGNGRVAEKMPQGSVLEPHDVIEDGGPQCVGATDSRTKFTGCCGYEGYQELGFGHEFNRKRC